MGKVTKEFDASTRLANRPFLVFDFRHSDAQPWAPKCPTVNKKLSYHRGTARRAVSKLNSRYVSLGLVWESKMYKTAKVTSRVIEGHWQWYHSKGHVVEFPISVPLQLCLYLAPLTRLL